MGIQILKSLKSLYTRNLHINPPIYLMTYNKVLTLKGGGELKKDISPFIYIALRILDKGEANETHAMIRFTC